MKTKHRLLSVFCKYYAKKLNLNQARLRQGVSL